MKANDPKSVADGRSLSIKLARLGRRIRSLPIPIFLVLGMGVTFAWVIFLCWATYALIALLIP